MPGGPRPAQEAAGFLDLGTLLVAEFCQATAHPLGHPGEGVDLAGEVGDHVVGCFHRQGGLPVGPQAGNVLLEGREVGGVGSVEAAAGALEADGTGTAAGSHVGRLGAVAERDRHRRPLDREAHARIRAIPEAELRGFLDADHPLRDKTLWWLLYETAARANEVLTLGLGDLDLPRRRAVVIGKGGRAELIGWETKTARLLPRLLHGRKRGPVFLAHIAPAPARQPALADLDPDSGRARLSYRRAAQLFSDATGGWTLHQLRHSRLTHLAEAGVGLPLLMTKSRHTSLTSLAVYARPTFDAVAAATAALDPARRP